MNDLTESKRSRLPELQCEICGRPASHVDSVPDPNKSPEPYTVYRRQFLCMAHAMDRKKTNTARVQPLEEE